ncbi:C4-type zinc finger protein, DksA/TraR family [Methylophaga frappieri]|uniref:C4-type zinc finger protein, DksA/TraR family n=1 Tax=Methylophaga frappieri (strain ATCC BAA-2434 / DSM 25690 / JAM7) TaxID=754477 RepID=I1YG97_METFJ|nr:TraR/DksA C4-type zinc finger protein [Methylophaga frappieri]AFJ01940.1 C4-type zinc finger protein, DksA/TraR family [Methylophaga frappieri]
MDEKTLLNASDDEYMNAEQLAFFDLRLQQLRQETLQEIEALRAEISQARVSDVSDRATLEEEAIIAIRIADRKRQLIPKIDAARHRIRMGDYGYCTQTGEPIGIQRLLLRPTAEFSTDAKTINEKKESHYDH